MEFVFCEGFAREIALVEIYADTVVEIVVFSTVFRIETTEEVQIRGKEVRTFSIFGHDFAIVVERHVVVDFHFCLASSFATCIVVVEIGRKWEIDIFIFAKIFEFGQPIAVTSLVMHKEGKGFVGISLFVQPLNGFVGDDVGEIPFDLVRTLCVVEIRVVVVALCRENIPMIKTRRFAHQMPLTHDGSLVTCLLQEFGHRLLSTIEDAMLVVGKSIFVGMLTSEHTGARRTAQGVGNERACEFHPVLRDAVEVGSFDITTVVGREHLRRVVVCHDVDDVVALLSGSAEG